MKFKKSNKSKDEIFEIYGKVLKGDKKAKDELCSIYIQEFPRNQSIVDGIRGAHSKYYFSCMYQHLLEKSLK